MHLIPEISCMWTVDGSNFNVADLYNKPFPNSFQPPFQSEARCEVFVMKISFIHIEIRTNYHNKNFALRLALKDRLMGARKWPLGHFGKYHNTLCLSPPKFCISIDSSSLGTYNGPKRKQKQSLCKIWGTNKEYYAIFWNGLLRYAAWFQSLFRSFFIA